MSGRVVPLLLVLWATGPGQASAQRLLGTVRLGERGVDSVPVSLHRVTSDSAGVVSTDSTRDSGRFSFRLPAVAQDAGFTVFFVTAEYRGIRYFGRALHPGEAQDGYTVSVYDTASAPAAGQGIRVSRRDVVLVPREAGGWEVNEILRLHNPGERTLVASRPGDVWRARIPSNATEFEVGGGEIDADDVTRMGDLLLLSAPLVPGTQELFFRYRVPPTDTLRLPLDQPTGEMNLLVREPAPPLRVEGLAATDTLQAEGERFLRYTGSDLTAAATVTVATASAPLGPISPPLAGAGAAAVLLGVGTWIALRRRPPPTRRER